MKEPCQSHIPKTSNPQNTIMMDCLNDYEEEMIEEKIYNNDIGTIGEIRVSCLTT